MKIDLVYLWIDGDDTQLRERRSHFLPPERLRDIESFSAGRFSQSEELRYSLRSVELYAPWVNHIYIVTDNQIPRWLDLNYPKVTIIDQSQILPESALPTFNSTVVELGLANIEGLSEYFLYANDDMLLCREVKPDTFITAEGLMRGRFKTSKESAEQISKSTYLTTIARVNEAIYRDFNVKMGGELRHLSPHHNIDIYSKSVIKEALECYSEWVDESMKSRFRSPNDMQRHLFSLYALATGRAEAIDVREGVYLKALKRLLCPSTGVESMVVNLPLSSFDRLRLRLYNPAMICVNDNEFATSDDREVVRAFLEGLYPKRSAFELPALSTHNI
ncbi:MAG: hypothetical protein SNG35_02530 [Rikenellaceae bacterium]